MLACSKVMMVDAIAKALNSDPLPFWIKYRRKPRVRAESQKMTDVGNCDRTIPTGFAQGEPKRQLM